VQAFEFPAHPCRGSKKSYIVDLAGRSSASGENPPRDRPGYMLSGEDVLGLRLFHGFHRRQWLADGIPMSRGRRDLQIPADPGNRAVYNELPYRMLVPEWDRQPPDGRPLRLDDP